MAVCWIEQVINSHPTGTLRFQVHDFKRHPTIKGVGKTLGPDEWYTVGPSTTVDLKNCAVPWGGGNNQALWVEATVDATTVKLQLDIMGQNAWDYMRIRDGEYREHARQEVGSLGNAAGTNHSAWRLVLHSDGKVEMHLEWRQGLTRDGAEEFGSVVLAIGGLAVSLAGAGIGAAGTIVAPAV